MLIYQGDSFPAEYRGKLFMNNIHGARINMDVPVRKGSGFVGQQGAIVLLFFGWVTGAQLLFVTYRMRAESPWRMMAMIILSLTIVVAGYTLLEHTFDLFLYPDRALSAAIFQAASINSTSSARLSA